jgi:hypothetical protein
MLDTALFVSTATTVIHPVLIKKALILTPTLKMLVVKKRMVIVMIVSKGRCKNAERQIITSLASIAVTVRSKQ